MPYNYTNDFIWLDLPRKELIIAGQVTHDCSYMKVVFKYGLNVTLMNVYKRLLSSFPETVFHSASLSHCWTMVPLDSAATSRQTLAITNTRWEPVLTQSLIPPASTGFRRCTTAVKWTTSPPHSCGCASHDRDMLPKQTKMEDYRRRRICGNATQSLTAHHIAQAVYADPANTTTSF